MEHTRKDQNALYAPPHARLALVILLAQPAQKVNCSKERLAKLLVPMETLTMKASVKFAILLALNAMDQIKKIVLIVLMDIP